MRALRLGLALLIAGIACAQEYDLLLKGGHVIDGKNRLSAVRDVAVKDGKVAAVAQNIAANRALKTVDVSGLYVTPGLIDIHVHVYTGNPVTGYAGGYSSVYPDGFTLRAGVTTVVDAGSSGWRNFEEFKDRIIDRSKTRVLAFLNVTGAGMGSTEGNKEDMDSKALIEMINKHKSTVVGVKSAHYGADDWKPYEVAKEATTATKTKVMIDFGSARVRTIDELFEKYLKPGDMYTHMYSGLRKEQDPTSLGPAKGMIAGRKKGIIFDVGHGGGSFAWRLAVPMMKAGFTPDSISTDLHIGSMNAGMKDMLNVMSKFLALGASLDNVILWSTWNPAKQIQHEELGNLSVGSTADIAVLRLQKGKFGFTDMHGAKLTAGQKLISELTFRDGKLVYDLNGMTRTDFDKLTEGARGQGDPRWDGFVRAGGARGGATKDGAKKGAPKQ